MEIRFTQLQCRSSSVTMDIDNWLIEPQQSWGVFSTEGDLGALLGLLFTQQAHDKTLAYSGQLLGVDRTKVALVSLHEQQQLLDDILDQDDSESLGYIDPKTTVYGVIFAQCNDEALTHRLLQQLNLIQLSASPFTQLSTGESRRVMLARAVATKVPFLVLDEPYAGLDVGHRQALSHYLQQLSQTVQMLVVVSREEDMPDWIEHIAMFNHGTLDSVMTKSEWDNHPLISQLTAQSGQQSEELLALIRRHRHSPSFANPVFQLNNGRVAYSDKVIFSGVNWRIDNGVHWQVKGPNGCGKSTLLGLIFGDHPQCYSNDIDIFGKKRGSGESIWEIKKHIGMVSSALHLQYRVNCSALDVIVSGFYDSIGLYQQASKQQVAIATEWLAILHMGHLSKSSFRQLEYGQQRLLLIARAIVKQPTLLILDEPYQGLDYLGRRLIKNALELIAKEHLSQLLYVSHYQEDSLDSIKHFIEFVADEHHGGYRAVITKS
ncbi:ATP-binding cassette domain-containing protein [Shewanella livingstonensis]|uniref:ATP-binding cassette domain-containing protein n=1 Tax=Shewanella livingstonensis TaxID=150120 RepID=A0A3G8LYP5_9GAMM|nr:ATP-binding cassette domain-containing protein [Shewanella livingstonensis]AZG73818.1 ATP-binding cassette domain-containing protein [Shewanella livingstonensis]